jgi:ATP-dependent helicase/DNAse subunit B
MDFGEFEKQSASMLNILKDMEQGLTRNMQEVSKMEGAEHVNSKMDELTVFMKNGDLAGILKIQEEIKETLKNQNVDTTHTDKR